MSENAAKVNVPVPIECPNPKCLGSGTIPANRLGNQLVCRACRTKFYVDLRGSSIVVGKRPDMVFSDPHLFEPERKRRRDLIDRWQRLSRRARKRWGELPERTRQRIRLGGFGLGVLGVVLAGMLVAWLMRGGPKMPKGVQSRSQLIAQAYLDNDMAPLLAVTTYGDDDALREWVELTRPKAWSRTPRLQFRIAVLAENKKSGKGVSSVEYIPPQPAPPRPAPQAPEEETAPEQDQVPAADSTGEAPEPSETPATDATEPGADPEPEPEIEAGPKPAPPPAIVHQLRLIWSYDGTEWYLNAKEMLRQVKPRDPSETESLGG